MSGRRIARLFLISFSLFALFLSAAAAPPSEQELKSMLASATREARHRTGVE